MQIPLDQFEQYIDETILKRGLSYFKNGQVNEPEEITTGVYEAIVEGSEAYTVQLKIKNGNITEHTCDCPYDMGPCLQACDGCNFLYAARAIGINTEGIFKKNQQKKRKQESLKQLPDK